MAENTELNPKQEIEQLLGHNIPALTNTVEKFLNIKELYTTNNITLEQYLELVNDLLDLEAINDSAETLETKILVKQAYDILNQIASKNPFF
jgi:hypothetical protein